MPFNEKFVCAAGREVKVQSAQKDFEIVRAYIMRALQKCAEQTDDIFDPAAAKIYVHGSYVNQTNIYFPSSLEIIVELKNTSEYDPSTFVEMGAKTKKEKFKQGEYRVYDNYYVDANLDFTPRSFRELFFECLASEIGMKASEKSKTITFDSFEKIKHTIEITPCFSFNYKNEVGEHFDGILFYDQSIGANIISFPHLHSKNGRIKDMETNSNFKRCVRLYKTLNAIYAREFGIAEPTTATGYFIECLLYNVPNKLFLNARGEQNIQSGKDDNTNKKQSANHSELSKKQYKAGALPGTSQLIDYDDEPGKYDSAELLEVFLKTLNYLNNCDMEEFICQNRVWKLFADPAEFWHIHQAKSFLHKISRMYNTFPESRTFLA